ncbi:hypothetical protein BU25DRAFT_222363 [Macroventuria anomochaeta]|uniref:Uncharacterized protein n=1 Tax=Macroventuria anomochaeta TaxID=301207 RepID=A0ACB6SBL9_9PLEO|nr:uncharacterized protein BU25DRAFT_222363 [Macroventuria anomochaeta]KAF2631000.1 hypothetical protein BU25DRAFT_222363 [Macroventuria anomochaeta]
MGQEMARGHARSTLTFSTPWKSTLTYRLGYIRTNRGTGDNATVRAEIATYSGWSKFRISDLTVSYLTRHHTRTREMRASISGTSVLRCGTPMGSWSRSWWCTIQVVCQTSDWCVTGPTDSRV